MNTSISLRSGAIVKNSGIAVGHMSATANAEFSSKQNRSPHSVEKENKDSLSTGDNPSNVKRKADSIFEERISWDISKTSVTIYKEKRLLKHKQGKSYSPAGEWIKSEVDNRICNGKPSYMTDTIPELSKSAALNSSEEIPAELHHGLFISSFLPSVVQSYLHDKVNVPHYLLGNLWTFDDDTQTPKSQSLELVRVGEEFAVLVTATRQIKYSGVNRDRAMSLLDEKFWNVKQYTFPLKPRRSISNNGPRTMSDLLYSF